MWERKEPGARGRQKGSEVKEVGGRRNRVGNVGSGVEEGKEKRKQEVRGKRT